MRVCFLREEGGGAHKRGIRELSSYILRRAWLYVEVARVSTRAGAGVSAARGGGGGGDAALDGAGAGAFSSSSSSASSSSKPSSSTARVVEIVAMFQTDYYISGRALGADYIEFN